MKKNKEMTPAANKYMSEVSERLVCPTGLRRSFLRQLGEEVGAYVGDHPDAPIEELYKEFGEPESFSSQLLDNKDYEKMLKKAKRRQIFWIVFSVCMLAVVAFLIVFIVDLIKTYGGEITVSEPRIISTSNIAIGIERIML